MKNDVFKNLVKDGLSNLNINDLEQIKSLVENKLEILQHQEKLGQLEEMKAHAWAEGRLEGVVEARCKVQQAQSLEAARNALDGLVAGRASPLGKSDPGP